MIHSASVPKVVEEYFLRNHGINTRFLANHPIIAQSYVPGKGWKDYPFKKRISGAWARKMREEGVTVVALQVGRFTVDFQIKELLRP